MKKYYIFFFVILSLAIYFRAKAKNEKEIYAKSFLGQKAPPITVEKWVSEKPDLNSKDKFILIDFWATRCGACRRAIPLLNSLHETFKDKLIVMGLSGESFEKIKDYQHRKVISYYSAIDSSQQLLKTYEVRGIPHVVIINPDGIVVWEGFPLAQGNVLTHEVVEKILKQ